MEDIFIDRSYEFFIKLFLLSLSYTKIYLCFEIPFQILVECGFFENYAERRKKRVHDLKNGIDNSFDLMYFNNVKRTLVKCMDHIYDNYIDRIYNFFDMLTRTELNGVLYHSSDITNKLKDLKYKKNNCVRKKYDVEKEEHEKQKKLKPWDYQYEAYEAIKYIVRGILWIPCGMGKTLISIMFAKQFDLIIICSPLKVFAEQNLKRYMDEMPNRKGILVDSDGTRDIDEIKSFFDKKLILSCTYKSIDVIETLIKDIKEEYDDKYVCVIVDEFHNLTKDNVLDNKDKFYKVLSQKWRYLFLSATPRVYDLDNIDEEIQNILGDIVYKYDFRAAINNGYICDYDVFVPQILKRKSSDKFLKAVYEEADIKEFDDDFDVKSLYLLRGMDENGHTKNISYLTNVKECKEFKKSLDKINKYFGLNLKVEVITSEVKQKKDKEY